MRREEKKEGEGAKEKEDEMGKEKEKEKEKSKLEKRRRDDDGEKRHMRKEFHRADVLVCMREGRREKGEGVGKERDPPSFPLHAHTRT